MLWSRQAIENSIKDTDLLNKLRIALEMYEPHERTGPLALKLLMDEQVQCSIHTRARIKATWLYEMGVTDYDGGNIIMFNADWRNIESFLQSLGEDVSDSARSYLQAMLNCPNQLFKNHFQTLQTMQSPKLGSTKDLMQEAHGTYRLLCADGKWTVRSKKEHSAFSAEKRRKQEAARLKSHKTAGSPPPSPPSSDESAKALQGKKTHDAKGHPIDRVPPKPGQPKNRVNPLTNKEEHFCEDPHCLRWGGHPTNKHQEWYKKLVDDKKKRKAAAERRAGSDSATTPGGGTPRANPLQIPRGSEPDFGGQPQG